MFGCASNQAQKTNRGAGLLGILALAAFALPSLGQTQQHSSLNGQHRRSAIVASPLQKAEGLIQQGLFEQARKIIEEQLQLDPSSVEAYNLMGIVYADPCNRRLPTGLKTGS